MAASKTQKVKGCRKAGRNKKVPNQKMSAYVRGLISFAEYQKQ